MRILAAVALLEGQGVMGAGSQSAPPHSVSRVPEEREGVTEHREGGKSLLQTLSDIIHNCRCIFGPYPLSPTCAVSILNLIFINIVLTEY